MLTAIPALGLRPRGACWPAESDAADGTVIPANHQVLYKTIDIEVGIT